MADLQATVEHALRDAVRAALGAEHADTDPLVRPATDPKFGDFQANLAMPLAKTLKQKPRDIAERIREPLAQNDLFDHVDIAGPGFINMTLSPVALQQHTAAMLADARLGLPEAEPETVVVDYSGPNVAKEMHVGHLRPTNIGDALVRVLEFAGHHVIRQNHLGDWGTQFGRVMLGLWYEAVALKKGEQDRLERWIREVANLPKKSPDESSDEERARRTAEDELLSEIVPWHVAAYEEDPKGDTYFIPYIKESFPNLDRLQVLYTFATSLTDLESAKERIIPNRQYGERPLAALPSLIATFVQNPDIQDNEQERIAWEKCVDVTVNACQRIYDRLDVLLKPDDVRGESFYNDKLQPLVADLEKAGLLQESRGARVV
ncbi:MAG: arginine--tRNA ligase, partial [Phycisphaeraceae bacterium]